VSSKIGNYASLAQAFGVTLAELVFGDNDSESWRKARMLLEMVKTLDDKRRAGYLDAANKLIERIDAI
jgi:hypothetical protein